MPPSRRKYEVEEHLEEEEMAKEEDTRSDVRRLLLLRILSPG